MCQIVESDVEMKGASSVITVYKVRQPTFNKNIPATVEGVAEPKRGGEGGLSLYRVPQLDFRRIA